MRCADGRVCQKKKTKGEHPDQAPAKKSGACFTKRLTCKKSDTERKRDFFT